MSTQSPGRCTAAVNLQMREKATGLASGCVHWHVSAVHVDAMGAGPRGLGADRVASVVVVLGARKKDTKDIWGSNRYDDDVRRALREQLSSDGLRVAASLLPFDISPQRPTRDSEKSGAGHLSPEISQSQTPSSSAATQGADVQSGTATPNKGSGALSRGSKKTNNILRGRAATPSERRTCSSNLQISYHPNDRIPVLGHGFLLKLQNGVTEETSERAADAGIEFHHSTGSDAWFGYGIASRDISGPTPLR